MDSCLQRWGPWKEHLLSKHPTFPSLDLLKSSQSPSAPEIRAILSIAILQARKVRLRVKSLSGTTRLVSDGF